MIVLHDLYYYTFKEYWTGEVTTYTFRRLVSGDRVYIMTLSITSKNDTVIIISNSDVEALHLDVYMSLNGVNQEVS